MNFSPHDDYYKYEFPVTRYYMFYSYLRKQKYRYRLILLNPTCIFQYFN